jgi:poly-gamma-glutamate synthesis protein (capsule biosynthesis protein)
MRRREILLCISAAARVVACGQPRADTAGSALERTAVAATVAARATAVAATISAPARTPEKPARIVVSVVGDCTLGGPYDALDSPGSLAAELAAHGGDMSWFFGGVKSVLAADDLTIANLETTLPSPAASPIAGKPRFKGRPEYVEMLLDGSVELVNVANNHSHDFGERGYHDTIDAVRAASIGVAGNGIVDKRVVKGVTITNLGFTAGDAGSIETIVKAVRAERRPGELLFVSFHWGNEGFNAPNDVQMKLGPAAIDAGADLVIGTHPHVLQGIESYKGRHIVYSLANFVFGGHSHPEDMDSMIVQEVFEARPGGPVPVETRVVPVRVSSVSDRNDFRPTLLEGDEAARVRARVDAYSAAVAKSRGRSAP